jgi:hypothetical protein
MQIAHHVQISKNALDLHIPIIALAQTYSVHKLASDEKKKDLLKILTTVQHVAIGRAKCDKICRLAAHSTGEKKISKNHHMMGTLLVYQYANFEVATTRCWTYRK